MKTLTDGRVVFRKPLPIALTNYTQDPNNPCIYIPNFEQCRFRFRPECITPCQKVKLGGFTCRLNGELVTPGVCKPCTVREE